MMKYCPSKEKLRDIATSYLEYLFLGIDISQYGLIDILFNISEKIGDWFCRNDLLRDNYFYSGESLISRLNSNIPQLCGFFNNETNLTTVKSKSLILNIGYPGMNFYDKTRKKIRYLDRNYNFLMIKVSYGYKKPDNIYKCFSISKDIEKSIIIYPSQIYTINKILDRNLIEFTKIKENYFKDFPDI